MNNTELVEKLRTIREHYHAAFNEKIVERGAAQLIEGDRLLLSMIERAQKDHPIAIEGQTVGARIKSAREARHMSQHKLLIELGRPKSDQSWLSRVEDDERDVSVALLKKISKALVVSIDELVP